jgi:UDP-2,3-diacylglucosamine pyrophosphatase LpxH
MTKMTNPIGASMLAILCLGCSYRSYRYESSPYLTSPAQPAGARSEVFVSDLHLGQGRAGDRWDAFEDFRWSAALHDFLQHLRSSEAGSVDLILLGDVLELWQYREGNCAGPDDLGCTEAESLQHATKVIAAHKADLAELGAFAQERDNRVVIVPGNHDGALLFPAVAQAVVTASGSGAPRLAVAQAGFWISNDGQVLADHGHQMDPLNAFPEWPNPFRSNGVKVRIRRPWGEVFVREFYNHYEDKYEILDNLASEATALGYARSVEGTLGTLKAAGQYVGLLLFKNSLSQLAGFLGADGRPAKAWKISQVRAQGGAFLRDSAAGDRTANLGQVVAALDPRDLEQAAAALSDAQIAAICDLRQAQHENAAGIGDPPVPLCPFTGSLGGSDNPESGSDGGSLGNMLDRRALDKVITDYLTGRYTALRDAQVVSRTFGYYIYGHTHVARSPWQIPWHGGTIKVVNTGAWQRVADDAAIKRIAPAGHPADVLKTASLEQLPACYSAVFARRGADGNREVTLQHWQYIGGQGQLAPNCAP